MQNRTDAIKFAEVQPRFRHQQRGHWNYTLEPLLIAVNHDTKNAKALEIPQVNESVRDLKAEVVDDVGRPEQAGYPFFDCH